MGRDEEVDGIALRLGHFLREAAHVEQLEHVLRAVSRNTVVVGLVGRGQLSHVVGEGFCLPQTLPEGVRIAEEKKESRSEPSPESWASDDDRDHRLRR